MKYYDRGNRISAAAHGGKMEPLENEPCPVMLANQRARAAMAFAAVSFVALGAVAWIGLDAIRAPADPKLIYSSAPPKGTAQQLMMALKAPRDRENERARLAILNDQDGPMVVKPLESVVELTQIDRGDVKLQPNAKPALIVAPVVQPEPVVVLAAVEPEPVIETIEPVVEVADCIDDLRVTAQSHTIRFGVGSANLEGTELPTLRKIGRMALACPEAILQVTGHTDSSGSDIVNLALSWQRADNTVAALAALGIDTAQFEPVGFGARTPSGQGDSSDEELNRRVEFVVLQSAGE
ncbi:OmpA family protein [Litoreibacter sp.]|nr:OmpA family protein [Litoreibacter sp.]